MKEVLEERVVEAVGGFSWPCLGHGLQEVDGTGRVSDEQVKEILWHRNTYKLLTQKKAKVNFERRFSLQHATQWKGGGA